MKDFLRIIFLLTLLFLNSAVCGQDDEESKQDKTRIRLVQADIMNFNKDRLGPNTQRLVEDVIFEHDSMFLHCDSAYLNSKTNSLEAWGNIHIRVSDSLNIYGDELYYKGNKQTAEMQNNVRLIDNQMTLNTDQLDYNLNKNTGKYTGGGKIVDTTNRLTSKIGYYYANKKKFFFKDSVRLNNPRYTMESDTLMYNTMTEVSYFYGPSYIRSDSNVIYCENGWYDTRNNVSQFKKNAYLTNNQQTLQGDSLYYDRDSGLGKAFLNVTITDSVHNIIIKGEYGRFLEKTNNSLITDSAQAIQVDEGDSLFMHADTLRYIGDTTTSEGKQLFAFYQVKLYRFNLQGKCDSLVYNVSDSLIKMYETPVLWSGKNQLYADSIELFTGDSKSKKMKLFHNAYLAEMDFDSTKYNQIKGKLMYGFFNNKELEKVYVEGNVETIYFVRNNQDSFIGVNKAESSTLNIHIENKKVSGLTFIIKPKAVLHPLQSLRPKDLKIKGFKWHGEKRPEDRYDIYRW